MPSSPDTLIPLPDRRAAICELDLITLAETVHGDDGRIVPAGTVGTVVAVWAGGSGFEVEFTEPVALATVTATQIASHRPFDG